MKRTFIQTLALILLAASLTLNAETKAAPAIAMVKIKAGSFLMGSPRSEVSRWDREDPQHKVTLKAFLISATEITQAQYRQLTGKDPSFFKGDTRPVEMVNWFDAVAFCNLLSQSQGLKPAYAINGTQVSFDPSSKGYRLPTEAEWEHAARAGTPGPFWTGISITPDWADYNGLYPYNNGPQGLNRQSTLAVASLKPNAWGLYDTAGNVAEWCNDWYEQYAVDAAPQTDPLGPDRGLYKVIRGGAWNSFAQLLRSAARVNDTTERQANSVGFRVARWG